MKIQHNGGWMVSTFAIVIVLIMSVTILAISTRVILSLNRGIDSYSERQAYWNAHSAVSVWESGLPFEATTTYNSVNGWDTGEIIIDSTGMKGIGKTGSDSNIVWIVELDEREEQDGGGDADPGTFYTFTNCGKEGRSGPNQDQVNATYNVENNTLNGGVTITTPGIQEWIVPADGTYSIEAWGAAGGTQLYQNDYPGGYGAKIIGSFTLTEDDVLKIIVGQKGEDTRTSVQCPTHCDNAAPGGGGGTYVWNGVNNTLLIAAGGGGGGFRFSHNGVHANFNTSGNAANSLSNGGTGGNGGLPNTGNYSYWAGGGAGWIKDGTGGNNETAHSYTPGVRGAHGGRRPLNGGLGGERWIDNQYLDEGGDGGFGGGGGGGSDNMGAGGGGGYSGGGGSKIFTGNPPPYDGWIGSTGGGGGSYCGDQDGGECVENVNATGDGGTWELNEGHGKVIITVMD
jgi:hypothetical protein